MTSDPKRLVQRLSHVFTAQGTAARHRRNSVTGTA